MTFGGWAEVSRLDVDPLTCFTIYEEFGSLVQQSFSTLAGILSAVPDLTLAERIGAVAEAAPQVISGGAAYLWLTEMYAALSADDIGLVRRLDADFGRFELAAAVASGADHSCKVRLGEKWISLPATGLAVRSSAGCVSVRQGQLDCEAIELPQIGALTVDRYEDLYRTPRSRSQFDLAPPGTVLTATTELEDAAKLGQVVVPGLFERYLTSLVPLAARSGMADAGTDDAAPFTVYSSFGRESSDLLAALAHEEAHALIQTLEKLRPNLLPTSVLDMPVPWKPAVRRKLPNVIHGLASFARAATVRSRVERLGLGSGGNREAHARERGWVEDATAELLQGRLGELPAGLDRWLDANLAQIEAEWRDGSALTDEPKVEVVAVSRPPLSYPWAIAVGESARAAAAELYAPVATGHWRRGTSSYPEQDSQLITLMIEKLPIAQQLMALTIPRLLEEEFGTSVELAAVKAHRLRPGDRIPIHSDGGHPTFTHRAVLGLSGNLGDSGQLAVYTTAKTPVIRLQPEYGQLFVFAMVPDCHHSVSRNESALSRLTVIASYRAAPAPLDEGTGPRV
ncbi:HEXXH motif-containing putative peptide modification protein [Kribbella sp. NPDC051718]|uniref:aKG-HExxH-type peptide beta-hydroxylase n=1 Tax=Kribbella sp. NPDC051718 TaxID=3155168 RepID=UPI0034475FC6